MSAKFISDSNISYILRTVKNDLCIKDFNPNREFINSVVSLMKRINNKYNTNDVSLLNQYTIKEITELMRPQYDVESSVQNKYVYTEEDDILRARVTGTTMGKKTKIMGTPIVRKTAEKKKLPKIAKKEKDLKQLFYEGNTVFRPEFSVWENTDEKLFYNQDLDIIYDPKIKKFYDVKTNKELEPGTKYTDTKVFFGLKKSKVIDKVQSGSKLAFYDRNMGDVVSSSIDRDIVTDYNEIQTKEYTISIDSRHRDIRVFPSPSRYTIAFQNKSNSQFGFINNLADQIKGIKRIELVDGRNKELSVESLVKRAKKIDKSFWVRFCVFKDMRNRGYIIKTALKFGADFRVYDRGIKPGEDHARWVVFPVHESKSLTWYDFAAKNRVAHSTRKRLLIAVVDDENDVSYWEAKWMRP